MKNTKFTPKDKRNETTKVWKKENKLFIRQSPSDLLEDDYPLQIEIDLVKKTYNIYVYDIYADSAK